MKLPAITPKQVEILQLLYRYRYLDRVQIQSFMGHKDKRRIISWLKDLRQKQYIEWIYSTDFIEKTKPAIYYLGINAIRCLKSLEYEDATPVYPPEEVRKRYQDHKRSRTFIDRCLLLANCCLTLELASNDQLSYSYLTESDYINPAHDYHFLAQHEILRPSLCIIRQEYRRGAAKPAITNYLMEIFDASLPRYRLRRRLKAYVSYLEDGEWGADNIEPIMLLVCPSLTELIYAKRASKKLIEDSYEDNVRIRFMTTGQLQQYGATAKLWEEGRQLFGL